MFTLDQQNLIFEGGETAEIHCAGARQLLALRGGIQSLDCMPPIKDVFLWTHSLLALYRGDWLNFHPIEKESAIRRRADHPFRLAVQPIRSGLSPQRMKCHFMVSFAGPEQLLFDSLHEMDVLVQRCLCTPYTMSPMDGRYAVKSIEDNLLRLGNQLPCHSLPADFFCEQDCRNQKQVISVIRLTCLVLHAQLMHILSGNAISSANLDHHIMAFHLFEINELLFSYPDVAFWALFIVASCTQELSIRSLAERRLCDLRTKLSIGSWESLCAFMDNLYFNRPLMELPGITLWKTLEERSKRM